MARVRSLAWERPHAKGTAKKKKKEKKNQGKKKRQNNEGGVPKTDLSVRKAEPSTVRPKNVFPRQQGSTLLSSFNKMRFFFFSLET